MNRGYTLLLWRKTWATLLLSEPGKKFSLLEAWLYLTNVLAASMDDAEAGRSEGSFAPARDISRRNGIGPARPSSGSSKTSRPRGCSSARSAPIQPMTAPILAWATARASRHATRRAPLLSAIMGLTTPRGPLCGTPDGPLRGPIKGTPPRMTEGGGRTDKDLQRFGTEPSARWFFSPVKMN